MNSEKAEFGRAGEVVLNLTDEEIEMWVTVAADAYVEVARKMLADGLMVNPPAGADVWPIPHSLDNMFMGAIF